MMIRPAEPEDIPAIHSLLSSRDMRGAVLPRTESAIGASLDDWLVGTHDSGQILGCVALEKRRSDLAEIRSLAVSRKARGQGVGNALLRSALACAWQQGFSSVFAQTQAISLFERVGFQPMKSDAEHRTLCGRKLRNGYRRVRADAIPLSVNAPKVPASMACPICSTLGKHQQNAAVGRCVAALEGTPMPIAAMLNEIAPPGFHFHRYHGALIEPPATVV